MAVTDEAIQSIKAMILSGELGPGSKLPREADLAERLGLSRNSLREAVKALSLINVLTVRQGDGTYVSSLDASLLTDALGFIVDFHRDDTVLQVLHVRRILEPAATAEAARLMPDTDVDGLADLLSSLRPDADVAELVANDMEFHRRISAGSGNPFLCTLLDSLSGRTQRARTWRGLAQSDALERTMSEHWAIQRAIAARDPEVARSWSTIHISGVEEFLRAMLQDGAVATESATDPAGEAG